jgi:hypothetical protein
VTEGPNAAVVRRGYEAFARRDVEAWLAGFHPDAELVELADHPDQGTFHGHAGLREWLEGNDALVSDWRFEVERLIEHGNRVLATTRFVGRGPQDLELEVRVFHVHELRDGRVARVCGYRDEADARAAAGF